MNTFVKILDLKSKVDEKIAHLNKKVPRARKLIEFLYKKPVINAMEVSIILNITANPAYGIIQNFMNLSILKEVTGNQRNRLFIFKEYLDLFQK